MANTRNWYITDRTEKCHEQYTDVMQKKQKYGKKIILEYCRENREMGLNLYQYTVEALSDSSKLYWNIV